ncbi:MAG: DNA topoisomerase VI subunit B [Candidatus Altarchaeaceae archaeon]
MENSYNEKERKSPGELFKDFREIQVSEFFRKNKAYLGYSGKIRSLTTIIHELVTNALDACEESEILPEIEVKIEKIDDEYKISCKDNALGIPEEYIGKVFGEMLAGTKFYKNAQTRGQQGIGVAGVTMFSLMTTGKPIRVVTSSKILNDNESECIDTKLTINISKNKPEILESKKFIGKFRGTLVELEVKDVEYSEGAQSPLEYLRLTAIANPHATIIFINPNGKKIVYERTSNIPVKKPKEIKPHPAGITADDLYNMSRTTNFRTVSSFLINSLSRFTQEKINELRMKLVESNIYIDLAKNPNDLTWEECEKIVSIFKNIKFMAPPSDGLRAIGEERILESIKNIANPEVCYAVTRKPSVYSGGIPFQVECAIGYGGNCGKRLKSGKEENLKVEIMRFANNVPLLFDAGGCVITKAIYDIDWNKYEIKNFENSNTLIFVNVLSTYIPYTSAGKQSISDEYEIYNEIRLALMEVARKIQNYLLEKEKEEIERTRMKILSVYAIPCSEAISILTDQNQEEIYNKFIKIIEKKY